MSRRFLIFIVLMVACGAAVAQLRGHGGPVRAIAVSSDGAYAVSASFDGSGIRWLLSTCQKVPSSVAWLLMLHGGGAMAMLLLLGALIPLHAQRAWWAKRNRMSGVVMLTLNSILIGTSFGLYYVGSEAIRPWMSNIHVAAGFGLPALLVVHVTLGRRTSRR